MNRCVFAHVLMGLRSLLLDKEELFHVPTPLQFQGHASLLKGVSFMALQRYAAAFLRQEIRFSYFLATNNQSAHLLMSACMQLDQMIACNHLQLLEITWMDVPISTNCSLGTYNVTVFCCWLLLVSCILSFP